VEKAKFGIGAQFYNVFNHPNYDLPIANRSQYGNFGQIVRTVSGPTSPFVRCWGGCFAAVDSIEGAVHVLREDRKEEEGGFFRAALFCLGRGGDCRRGEESAVVGKFGGGVSCVKAEAELPFDRLRAGRTPKRSRRGSEGVSEMRRVRRENKRRGCGSGVGGLRVVRDDCNGRFFIAIRVVSIRANGEIRVGCGGACTFSQHLEVCRRTGRPVRQSSEGWQFYEEQIRKIQGMLAGMVLVAASAGLARRKKLPRAGKF